MINEIISHRREKSWCRVAPDPKRHGCDLDRTGECGVNLNLPRDHDFWEKMRDDCEEFILAWDHTIPSSLIRAVCGRVAHREGKRGRAPGLDPPVSFGQALGGRVPVP